MNITYSEKSTKWKSEKQLELLNRLIQFTNLPYYGESYNYSLPESFRNKLPYIESNMNGEGITIRRLTNFSKDNLNTFVNHCDKIYFRVMNKTNDWENQSHSFVKLDDDERTLRLGFHHFGLGLVGKNENLTLQKTP